jgi:hypothetical protein
MVTSKEIVQKPPPPPQKKRERKVGSKPRKGDQEQEAKDESRQNHRNPNPRKPQERRIAFRILGQNTEESVQDPNEATPEEGKEDQHSKDKGNTSIEEDGTQSNPPQQQDGLQNAEDGEIQVGSDSEEVNEIWISPKKKGRGRKSKIDERNQEAHNAVLNGSQSTIKSTFTGHQTRKQIKASQGGLPPP